MSSYLLAYSKMVGRVNIWWYHHGLGNELSDCVWNIGAHIWRACQIIIRCFFQSTTTNNITFNDGICASSTSASSHPQAQNSDSSDANTKKNKFQQHRLFMSYSILRFMLRSLLSLRMLGLLQLSLQPHQHNRIAHRHSRLDL